MNVTKSWSREGRKRTNGKDQLCHIGASDHFGRVVMPAGGDVEASGNKRK